jgi:CRISPR/Cas system-associated endonuclease Cas1
LHFGTHIEGRIGYRERARRNSRIGDIHSVDARYDHEVYDLMEPLRPYIDRKLYR